VKEGDRGTEKSREGAFGWAHTVRPQVQNPVIGERKMVWEVAKGDCEQTKGGRKLRKP